MNEEQQTPLQQAQEIFRRVTGLCQELAALEEKKIPTPELAELKAAIPAAQQRTHEVAGDPDAIRMDLQDAVMDELKAWQQYAEGLETYLETAGRALKGEYSSGAVPVPLATLTYAATALEGSSDNGDRYAAMQIRRAIAKHPVPEAYTIRDSAGAPLWDIPAEEQPTPPAEVVAIARDLLEGYGHHAVAEALAAVQPYTMADLAQSVEETEKADRIISLDMGRDATKPITATRVKELDPKPWKVRPVEGRGTKGPTSFATLEQGYSNAIMEFKPGAEFEQVWTRYPEKQQPKLDPKPWIYALLGEPEIESDKGREAEQVTGGFVFAPRARYVQEKGYYA